jgi:inosine-uridine nucleoside N-ribohydrolase
MHDPLAVTAAVRPDLLDWQDAYVELVTHDQLGRGIAVVDRLDSAQSRSPNCSLAVGVDAASVREYVFSLLAKI